MKNSRKILLGLLGLSVIFAGFMYAAEIPGVGGPISSPTAGQNFLPNESIPISFPTAPGNYYNVYLCQGLSTGSAAAGLTGSTLSAYFDGQVGTGNCWVVERDYFAEGSEYTNTLDASWFSVREIYLSEGDYQIHITNGCDVPAPSITGSVEV